MTFSIIGGDLRQLTVAALLEKDNYDVSIYGFDFGPDTGALKKSHSLSDALTRDVVILPLPVSRDNRTLNAPYTAESIPLSELSKHKSNVVLGGKTGGMPNVLDYFEREELSVANAIPTAEGAIEIALSETERTLFGSKCLVIGFGRCGKILADRLKGLGCRVTAAARKSADFAWIKAYGFEPCDSRRLSGAVSGFDIIFNTAPALLLDGEILKQIPKHTLIIDLSSKPGGVDFELARSLGLRVIWALSLPGKCAPVTSGEIIKETIVNMLKETEMIQT